MQRPLGGYPLPKWPAELARFESFLLEAGLSLEEEMEPDPASFGNFRQEYSNADVVVSMGYDREWFVTVSARGSYPHDDYDPGLLREFLGRRGTEVPPMNEEVEFLIAAWADILTSFSLPQRQASCSRLDELRKGRARKLFPGFGA